MVAISFDILWYYVSIMGWIQYYFVNSFASQLPWSTCENWWNTQHCSCWSNIFYVMFLYTILDKASLITSLFICLAMPMCRMYWPTVPFLYRLPVACVTVSNALGRETHDHAGRLWGCVKCFFYVNFMCNIHFNNNSGFMLIACVDR